MPTDHGDDALLERLGEALRPPDTEPSAPELALLHGAVTARASLGSRPRPWAHPRAWPRRVVAGVAACLLLGVLLTGPTLPRPLRSFAHAVRLPVDSVQVAEAKSAVADLQAALDAGDHERAARSSAVLRRRLEALDERDRRRLSGKAAPLLERAARSPGATPGAPPGPQPGPRPGGTVPASPPSTPPATHPSTTSTTRATTTTTVGTSPTTERTATTRGEVAR